MLLQEYPSQAPVSSLYLIAHSLQLSPAIAFQSPAVLCGLLALGLFLHQMFLK